MYPVTRFVRRALPRRLASGLGACVLLAALVAAPATNAVAHRNPHPAQAKPTIVLVHGAWADTSSWSGVITALQRDGYPVAAVPNPLRSLSGDAASVATYLDSLDGPVILVGHSYGGAVITNAATSDPDVRALVYVNADLPDVGESVAALAGPTSALSVADPATVFHFVPPLLPPTPATDVYLNTATFRTAFANGLNGRDTSVLAATQRPVTVAALNEPSGPPAWRTIPSWALIGTQDKVIPPDAQRAMAIHASATISYFRAGHLGLISDPVAVTRTIERAAAATS